MRDVSDHPATPTHSNTEPIHVFGVPFDLERLTYTTVVLMSVLVVYDKWGELTTFIGTAEEVPDEEVINAIRSVPCHY